MAVTLTPLKDFGIYLKPGVY